MTNRFTRAAALAVAALSFPALLSAQASTHTASARAAPPSAAAAASARQWYAELQQIQARLQAAHDKVMQDAQLRSAQEALMAEVKAAMLRADPGLDALAHRAQALQGEGEAAEQRGDRARLQQLNTEYAQIQARFTRAQQQALAQPALARRGRALDQQIHQRMLQVEPETDRLLARGNELRGRLLRFARQNGIPGAQDD